MEQRRDTPSDRLVGELSSLHQMLDPHAAPLEGAPDDGIPVLKDAVPGTTLRLPRKVAGELRHQLEEIIGTLVESRLGGDRAELKSQLVQETFKHLDRN